MNVLYIATMAKNRNRLDGETIKCQLLEQYLKNIKEINVISIDTDNWKKHIPKLVIQIIKNYFKVNKIIISSADRGANIVLSFFKKIASKKDIYYFVIGGTLYKNIIENKWKTQTYQKIKKIYVEADSLKDDLKKIGIINVEKLNNFRKIEKFKENYKKEEYVKFVYFGRVIKEKGIEEAIKLIDRLNCEGYNCRLDIYGQCEEEYYNKIKKIFSDSIYYLGEIKPNNKKEYEILSQYDIFIFPTEYPGECLPGALIDSYISGLAVLASNWKYATEYIKDGQNGRIFEYKNYEDMYYKAKEMIESKKINEYKKESKMMSKMYSIEENLKKFKKELIKK